MRRVTIGFNQDYAALMGLPGTQSLWQQPYRRWYAADEDELAILLDYVHYDPVRHRLVHRPEEWRHSSYQYWVERKLYKLGGGGRRRRRFTASDLNDTTIGAGP
ncbi:MAG: hypothetical protein R2851_22690 [Caldilineaceae bacterium]